jgi:putative transposase
VAPKVGAAPRRPTKVTATAPHHVWHVDITVVPTLAGFWVPWVPLALAQRWPFSWHVAIILDHFSRAVVHAGVFLREPTAAQMCRLLQEAARSVGGAPSYVVTDQGTQFGSEYLDWCERNDVSPRYGAIGQHGSIALVERFMRTLKAEGLRRILIPLTLSRMRRDVAAFALWYNAHRPHRALGGATPAEIRDGRVPTRDATSWEVRPRYPLRDGRATKRRRRAGGALRLVVTNVEGRKHLPIVELRRAA